MIGISKYVIYLLLVVAPAHDAPSKVLERQQPSGIVNSAINHLAPAVDLLRSRAQLISKQSRGR